MTERTDVETYTEKDLDRWSDLARLMQANAVLDRDARVVGDAVDDICSGAGLYNELPEAVADLLREAIETGYAQALRDVRDGGVDGLGPLDDIQ